MVKVEGRNPVFEAIKAGANITKVYIKEGYQDNPKLLQLANKVIGRGIPFRIISKKKLDNLSVTGIHQGIIALKKNSDVLTIKQLIEHTDSTKREAFYIYIRESQNEYNVGSIIRTAECVGANGVILPPKLKISEQIIRASMGAIEHVQIASDSLFNAVKHCRDNAIKVIGIEVTGSANYFDADLTGPAMFIIGGEDRSLSETITDKCDQVVKMPLLGKVNSLNMSIAAGVVLFDKLRQEVEVG